MIAARNSVDRDDDATEARSAPRIPWLIRLRWVAVLGVLGVIIVAGPMLGMISDATPLFVLAGALALWNLGLVLRERRGLRTQSAGSQVAVDLAVLAALLYWSGGLQNPFSIFMVVQVILGAILLPRRTALKLGAFGATLTLTLAALDMLGRLPRTTLQDEVASGTLSLWAVSLALLITIGVALWFTITIMEDLRARGRDAERYHEQADLERRKLFEVVRSVGAAMVVLDRDLRVLWQNPRAEDQLGRLATGAAFALPDGEAWPTAGDLAAGRLLEREWKGRDAHGRPRVLHVTASPVRERAEALDQVILVFTDITDQRAAQQQLHRTEKLSALGRLAAGVAHEINTPLGSVRILGSEAMEALPRALRGDAAAADEMREHLADIRQETERITTLVRRLLELSHPGDERIAPCDLARLAEDVVRLVTVRSPRSRGRIRTAGEPGLVVHTSAGRLRQVLMNVLDNALDATQKNQGEVVVSASRQDGAARIEVQDRGEGIAESDLPRLFEPFFTTKEVGEGTGLGLYVSYEIMKNLGGDIGIESRAGEGTRVWLTLPAAPAAADPPRP